MYSLRADCIFFNMFLRNVSQREPPFYSQLWTRLKYVAASSPVVLPTVPLEKGEQSANSRLENSQFPVSHFNQTHQRRWASSPQQWRHTPARRPTSRRTCKQDRWPRRAAMWARVLPYASAKSSAGRFRPHLSSSRRRHPSWEDKDRRRNVIVFPADLTQRWTEYQRVGAATAKTVVPVFVSTFETKKTRINPGG